MIGTQFYQLYTRLLNEATSIDDLIAGFVNHVVNTNPDLLYCYGATAEKGCLHSVVQKNGFMYTPQLLAMTVADVHRQLFGLKDYYISTASHISGAPYLSGENHTELSNHLVRAAGVDGTTLNLMFFCDGLLKGLVLMVFPEDYVFNDQAINEVKFLRNSTEAILYKIARVQDQSMVNHLFTAGENMVKARQSPNHERLSRLLNLTFELSGEADYGSCLLFKEGYWTFAHCIGHDYQALKEVRLPEDLYVQYATEWTTRKEVAPNIYVVTDILGPNASPIYNKNTAIYDKVVTSSHPIKETLQLHIYFGTLLKAIISLDIKEGSPNTFTNHTTTVMRHIDFLGQILFTNDSMVKTSRSIERLTELFTQLIENNENKQTTFLNEYLNLMVDSLYEASYASAYIRDRQGIHFLATVGHDLEALKAIDLKPEHFISSDLIDQYQVPFVDHHGQARPVSATLFSDLLTYADNNMPSEIYQAYLDASLPMKDGIISQAKLSDDSYMYISCDIKKDSPLSFSKDSIQLFSALNNLGFSFISNQYYVEQYKDLNADLEAKIQERTLALEVSNKKLQAIAIKDSMTGLLNHKAILAKLRDLLHAQTPLSLLLFDIDYFKSVNDTYGHPKGDDVLIGISNILLEDPMVHAGRYGGEEFLILLPGLDATSAKDYCLKLLETIRTNNFIPDHPITISGGLITNIKANDASSLIKSADKLLYKAKNSGRDQLMVGVE